MLTFISSPYTHPEPEMEAQRAIQAGDFAAYLWKERGLIPISPIAHWHAIGKRNQLPTNAMAWVDWNKCMVQHADLMYVLCLDGWRDSLGVTYEIQIASEADIPIYYATVKGRNAYAIKSRPPYL